MTQKFINNFSTTVSQTLGVSDVFLYLANVTGLPTLTGDDYFLLTVFRKVGVVESGHEVVKVTAITGNMLTVQRSVEGAAGSVFVVGSLVEARVTAGAFSAKEDANVNIQQHIASSSNPHSTTKAQVGLGNVDNTSDANKPISTGTQTALNLKQPLIGTISGLAKGNGANALTAAIAGTDYLAPAAIGVTVQAYDADTAKTDVAQNFTLPQRSALLTDNDGNFDLSAKQNFKCTTAAGLTLTFTNQADGLSGSVVFINTSNHAISAHANTKLTTSDLTKLGATGTYRIDYISDSVNSYCSVVGPYA